MTRFAPFRSDIGRWIHEVTLHLGTAYWPDFVPLLGTYLPDMVLCFFKPVILMRCSIRWEPDMY